MVVGESDAASGVPIAFRWTAAEGMMALGVLPGGFTSAAYDVSADGSTVVGRSNTQGANTPTSGDEAFRWTEEDGLQGLGDLPGGAFISHANGTSADGSNVVGYSRVGTRTDITSAFEHLMVFEGLIASLGDRLREKQRRAARRVALRFVVKLKKLGIELVAQKTARLSRQPTQHIHGE